MRIKPCLCLELHAGLHEAALVVIGLDAAEALGVDLVDRDMKVKVACVEMRGRQPLMPAKPNPFDQDPLDVFELGERGPFAGREGNYKVIGAIALGALVHGLGRENFLEREFRIHRNAVREADIGGPAFLGPKDVVRHARHHRLLLLDGAIEDIAAEAPEVRGAALAHNSLGDHGHTCPYRFPILGICFAGVLGSGSFGRSEEGAGFGHGASRAIMAVSKTLSWLLAHQLAKLVELVAKPHGDLLEPLSHVGIASPAHDGLDVADEVLGFLQKTRRRNQLLRFGLHSGCT